MRILIVSLAMLLLLGCATGGHNYRGNDSMPGRMVSLSTGTVYPMEFQLTQGSGWVTASNPVTGEHFQGTYTAVRDTRHTQYKSRSFWGDEVTQEAVETSTSVPVSAVLVGDKGTVINMKLQVQPGDNIHLPVGFGEGEDNKGNKYNIQL